MVDNVLDFLKNILTDFYQTRSALKIDALQVYTILTAKSLRCENIETGQGTILTFPIPNIGTLFIYSNHYNEAKKFWAAREKVTAIRTIRGNGWLGFPQDRNRPGLRESKEFCEAQFGL